MSINTALGVSDEIYENLVAMLPGILVDSLDEKSPNEVKAAMGQKILAKRIDEHGSNVYCLVGIMVEQAYNAAVLNAKAKRPLFGRINPKR